MSEEAQAQYNAAYDESIVPQEQARPNQALATGREAIKTLQSTFVLNLTGGKRAVPNMLGTAMMVHTGNGIVYFQPHKEVLYEVVEVAWDGPRFHTKLVTDEADISKTRTGRKGRVTGALIGSMFGPVGTVLGASVGTGKKSKTKGRARSETYEQQEELPAACRIVLEELSSRREVTIYTQLTGDKASDLLALVEDYEREEDEVEATPETSVDAFEELKKMKELLDMGILTQEEFDAKKAELLGL